MDCLNSIRHWYFTLICYVKCQSGGIWYGVLGISTGNDSEKQEIKCMCSTINLSISNNSIFYAILKRYFCMAGVSHFNGLEITVAHKRSQFWMHCNNYGQEISLFLKSVLNCT